MTWTKLDNAAIQSGDYVIRKGGWLNGTVYRLFYQGKLVVICPTAERAKEMAEKGEKR